MKRYITFAALMILALSLPAFSELENQKCGPYQVSFNLTTIGKMNISQLKPVYYGENVQYGLRLSDGNGKERGLIGICTFYRPAPSYISLDNLATFVEESYKNLTYGHLTRNQRTIDNHSAYVVTATDAQGQLNWIAAYWIVNGGTEVEIQGSYGWEMKDIKALLDSIHLEKVGF